MEQKNMDEIMQKAACYEEGELLSRHDIKDHKKFPAEEYDGVCCDTRGCFYKTIVDYIQYCAIGKE